MTIENFKFTKIWTNRGGIINTLKCSIEGTFEGGKGTYALLKNIEGLEDFNEVGGLIPIHLSSFLNKFEPTIEE
tara:strand:- start:476 stop:697 length:222 start_codon:yes stop_codon:yes gene_type:complete